LLGLAFTVLGGCRGDRTPSGDTDSGTAAVDAPPADASALDAGTAALDAPPYDAGCAPRVLSPPPWLDEYEREIVGTLSGEREIAPGVRLAERGTVASRDRARSWIRAELTSLGLATSLHEYGTGSNVIATLGATTAPGTARIVLGAHFDGVTIGPAAADNATGVALVLALARQLVETTTCRSSDAVFVLFDEEEIGLVGSSEYAERLAAEAVPVVAVHSFDMISWDMDADRAIELWLPSTELATLWEEDAAAQGAHTAPQRFLGSDHMAFRDLGMPAVGVSEEFVGGDRTPYYHTEADSYDKVDFAYLAMVTSVAMDVLARQLGP